MLFNNTWFVVTNHQTQHMFIWRLAICSGINNHAKSCTLEKAPEERETAPDRPSIQPTVRPTDRPKAAPPLLWWRPTAATFVAAKNRVDVVAVNTIFALRLSRTGRTVVGRTFGWIDGRSDAVSLSSGSIFTWSRPAQKANDQPPYVLQQQLRNTISFHRLLHLRTPANQPLKYPSLHFHFFWHVSNSSDLFA